MKSENAIEVSNLSKAYDGQTIIKDINFSVKRGEIFVVVGGSGSGKSTLLKQMIGLETPTEGEVIIEGENFTVANEKKKRIILRKFGVLFQMSGLFASMTLAENIQLPLKEYTNLSNQRIEEIIELKLDSVGLAGYQNFLPSEISGGMRKRAALARAMALDPDILFFDEPSSGLDPVTSASLDNLIKEINEGIGTTMVIISHDLQSVLSIADNIILLHQSSKSIIAEGSPEELKNMKDNINVYNFFNRIAE